MGETVFTARYWRYHAEGQQECDSLDEAVAFLAVGLDDGQLSERDVLGPDGTIVLEGEELSKRVHTHLGV